MRSCAASLSCIISELRVCGHEPKLTGRLIDLVAEDNAIEDTIYHMTRALDNERVDLDRFLKVRRVGRFLPVCCCLVLISGDPISRSGTVYEAGTHRADSAGHGPDVVILRLYHCIVMHLSPSEPQSERMLKPLQLRVRNHPSYMSATRLTGSAQHSR